MSTDQIQKLLDQAAAAARRQAGPLPGVEPEPDGEETIRRRVSIDERAHFDYLVACGIDPITGKELIS